MVAEFSRPVALERMPSTMMVEATAPERSALAGRLRIVAVARLRCRFTLRRVGDAVEAEGALEAQVVQDCVVSLEPVAQAVSEVFRLRFVPEGEERDLMDPESPDEIGHDGRTIDLGEAAAEQLALALDPYPRADGAELDPSATEDEGGAFAGLAQLRRD